MLSHSDSTAWKKSRFFVLFIDNISYFAFVCSMKKKSKEFQCMMDYEVMANSMFGVDQGNEPVM